MIRKIPLLVAVTATLFTLCANAAGISNFSQAKTAGVKVNADVPGDFYCGCPIVWQGKKGIPDLKACGYQVRKNSVRANRIDYYDVPSSTLS